MPDVPLTFVEDTARSVLPLNLAVDREPVRAAATLISELVRRLNHATLNDPAAALPTPADVARVLGELRQALAGMQQLLQQIGRRFDQFDLTLIGVDGRPGLKDAAAVADLAAMLLDQAAEMAEMAGGVVQQAADSAGRLTWHGPASE